MLELKSVQPQPVAHGFSASNSATESSERQPRDFLVLSPPAPQGALDPSPGDDEDEKQEIAHVHYGVHNMSIRGTGARWYHGKSSGMALFRDAVDAKHGDQSSHSPQHGFIYSGAQSGTMPPVSLAFSCFDIYVVVSQAYATSLVVRSPSQ